MNKTDLITEVANKSGLSKKDAENAVTAFTDTIIEQLKDGAKVQIVGFGTFEPRTRAAREGVNPQTGEKIEIDASVVPAFKAGKAFKDAIKGVDQG